MLVVMGWSLQCSYFVGRSLCLRHYGSIDLSHGKLVAFCMALLVGCFIIGVVGQPLLFAMGWPPWVNRCGRVAIGYCSGLVALCWLLCVSCCGSITQLLQIGCCKSVTLAVNPFVESIMGQLICQLVAIGWPFCIGQSLLFNLQIDMVLLRGNIT